MEPFPPTMDPQPVSPPTSADSSRSGSPDTRATTPSSSTEYIRHTYLPARFVRISRMVISRQVIQTLFEKHAISNRMGLIVENEFVDATSFVEEEWESQKVQFPAVDYTVSSSYCLPERRAACLSTDPIRAHHLYIFSLSALRVILSVSIDTGVTLHILEKPTFSYPPLPHTVAHSLVPSTDCTSGNIPTIEDWKRLWATWDLVTLKMIPPLLLHQKPIDLRHKCLFYIGHIPTFLDMLISKAIGGEPSEPKYFWNIFERGIDPHVDNPDHCHNHSDVPENDEDWPTLDSIVQFRDRVRQRLLAIYEDLATGKRTLTRTVARMLFMTHEHEGFHSETLLYMLIQRGGAGTLPPPGFTPPPWACLSSQWTSIPSPSSPTVLIQNTVITLGHNDSEADDFVAESGKPNLDVKGHTFGWDNESPIRTVAVGAFRAEWRCITNGEFLPYWKEMEEIIPLPASWISDGGEIKVRTLFGPVPMDVAYHWPVLTAYDDLVAYAVSKGGRLPTEPELRLFLDLYDVGFDGGANIGFRHWHPTPGTMGLDAYGGQGSNGGVWEWTTTVFDTHEGFVPTKLFTGYSEDFFDNKHQVVLGASYATLPRLAGRRTLRNFYQHNYPYPWVGARVVYDA